jgi:transposase
MGKSKELTNTQRIEIIRLKAEGYSQRQIGNQVGCDHTTVSYTLKKYKAEKTVSNLYRSGRPMISTPRDQRALVAMVKENRRTSSTDLALQWKLSNGQIASPQTVRKVLCDVGLMWRPAAKKPRITKAHKKKRLEFCKLHKSWTKLRWRDVLWSDEMNVERDNRKGRIMLRRTTDEKYSPDCIVERTRKGSGSIGIWACMNYNGVLFFRLYQGRLNSERYTEILGNEMLPALDLIGDRQNTIFQQDNAPCHTAGIIKDFFKENNIVVLDWPANSPDLNPIENLWSWLDIQLSKRVIGTLDELRAVIIDILSNVPLEICHNLVDSMPNRINECLTVKGGMTRY